MILKVTEKYLSLKEQRQRSGYKVNAQGMNIWNKHTCTYVHCFIQVQLTSGEGGKATIAGKLFTGNSAEKKKSLKTEKGEGVHLELKSGYHSSQ